MRFCKPHFNVFKGLLTGMSPYVVFTRQLEIFFQIIFSFGVIWYIDNISDAYQDSSLDLSDLASKLQSNFRTFADKTAERVRLKFRG